MDQKEYKFVLNADHREDFDLLENHQEWLNAMGQEGWDLVSYNDITHLFKRTIEKPFEIDHNVVAYPVPKRWDHKCRDNEFYSFFWEVEHCEKCGMLRPEMWGPTTPLATTRDENLVKSEPAFEKWSHDCAIGQKVTLSGWTPNCPHCGVERPDPIEIRVSEG